MKERIKTAELCKRLDVSRSTFDKVTRFIPGFPKPFRLSPRVILWDWEDVEKWIEAQKSTAA